MFKLRFFPFFVLLSSLILFRVASAAEQEEQEETVTKEIPEPTQFVTQHSGRFNNERVDYDAIAGETYIRDLEGKPKATIFTFSYIKTNLA